MGGQATLFRAICQKAGAIFDATMNMGMDLAMVCVCVECIDKGRSFFLPSQHCHPTKIICELL